MADYNINAITRRVVFTGSAGLGPYAFSFEILANTDIVAYFNATKLTLTTDFTVAINANGTGSVTLVVNVGGNIPATPTGSDQVVIIGARDIERVTDFVTAGDLLASSLNEQLDALTIFDQQVAEENKRGMRAPAFDPALVEDGGVVDMTLPSKTSRAGKTLAFDTNGNPVAGEDIGNWRGNWAASVAFNVRDLVKDASNSNVYRVNTAHTSSGSTPISSNADVAKFDLVIDASAAGASATAAAASATASATSATASATSATASATSATASATAKTASETAKTASEAAQAAAESARDATLLAYDNFDDRYLGVFSSDPTVDNDGDALVAGSLYFNSTDGAMKVYTGSAWVAAYVSGTGFLATTGGTMTGDITLTGSNIISASNANVNIVPNGTGDVTLQSDTVQVGDANANATLTTNGTGDLILNTNSGTNSGSITIADGANGNISVSPNGTGQIALGNFTLDADQSVGSGQDNYVLTYDHSSTSISLEAAAGGGGGAVGGGSDEIFYENGQNVTTNYTITNGKNAMSAGPITVDSGVTVTVGSGETWTVV